MRKRETFRGLFIVLIAAVVLILPAAFTDRASATEGGGGAYPNGAEDFMVGALPPPGTYFKNYMTYYTASTFKDNNGNDLIPRFQAQRVCRNAEADLCDQDRDPRRQLGDARLSAARLRGRHDRRPTDDRWGLGDIIVDPFILGWHFPNFHVTTGLDIYIPTGTYNQDHLANTGRNYWTFEPIVAMTYLSDSGFELSAKFMYDFNTENDDTNYQSGQEFHFDYTVGYHIGKQWAVGLGGYYYYPDNGR